MNLTSTGEMIMQANDLIWQVQCEEYYHEYIPTDAELREVMMPIKRRVTWGQQMRAFFWLTLGLVAPVVLLPMIYILLMIDPSWHTVLVAAIIMTECFGCLYVVRNVWRDIKAGNWVY